MEAKSGSRSHNSHASAPADAYRNVSVEEAATIAVREVRASLEANVLPERVLLVAFDQDTYEVLTAALG